MLDLVFGVVFLLFAVFVVDRMSGGALKEWIKDKFK